MAGERKKTQVEEIKESTERQTKPKKTEINDAMNIEVRSSFVGTLIYENEASGESYSWQYGDTHAVPLSELRSMKAKHVGFFKDQWIVISGVAGNDDITPEEICKYLHVENFYKDYLEPNYDVICDLSINEIEDKVKLMSNNAKRNLIVALNDFIANGQLDSLSKIKAFEKVLECKLAIPE